jgi:hypothetical protein
VTLRKKTTYPSEFRICPEVKKEKKTTELQGWDEIAEFLGLPVTTAKRWQRSGMPVHRGGRYVYAVPDELNRWVSSETSSGSRVHIASENEDLAADLKQALSDARRKQKTKTKPERKAA